MESFSDLIAGQPPAPAPAAPLEARLRVAPALPPLVRDAERGEVVLARPWVLPLLDTTMAAAGFVLGYVARYVLHAGGIHQVVVPVHPLTLMLLGLVATILTVLELTHGGLYRRRLGLGSIETYVTIGRAATVAMAVVIVVSAALQQATISRLVYLYAWVGIVGLVSAGRLGRLAALGRIYRGGRGVRRVIVVGATPTGKMVMQNVAAHYGRGYQVCGFIGEHSAAPKRFGRFARLGTVAELDRVLSEHHVDDCIVALPSASHTHVAGIVERCRQAGVGVKVVPDLFDLQLKSVSMDAVAGIPLIGVCDQRPDRLHRALKRTLDLCGAVAALILAAPVMALIALAIRLDSPGPILFKQERLGKDQQPFTILKFRSMRLDAERQLALFRASNEASGPIFKMRHDPRVTRVGRVIRKLSLDELPQLWNVVRGEMSLVGPRPPLASEVAEYESWHCRRLEVTPGITCLWGIRGRSNLDFDEMVMLDLYYIDNWSLGLDLSILVYTALSLLRPSGAY